MTFLPPKITDRVLLGFTWAAIAVLFGAVRSPQESLSIIVWPPLTYFLFAVLCYYTVRPSLGAFAMPRVVARILRVFTWLGMLAMLYRFIQTYTFGYGLETLSSVITVLFVALSFPVNPDPGSESIPARARRLLGALRLVLLYVLLLIILSRASLPIRRLALLIPSMLSIFWFVATIPRPNEKKLSPRNEGAIQGVTWFILVATLGLLFLTVIMAPVS